MGAELAVALILGLLDRATAIGALLQKAKAENRDITEAELDSILAADTAARDDLTAKIAKAKAEGR